MLDTPIVIFVGTTALAFGGWIFTNMQRIAGIEARQFMVLDKLKEMESHGGVTATQHRELIDRIVRIEDHNQKCTDRHESLEKQLTIIMDRLAPK